MKNALGHEHEPGSPDTRPADDQTSVFDSDELQALKDYVENADEINAALIQGVDFDIAEPAEKPTGSESDPVKPA
jgi:hypothetical protein